MPVLRILSSNSKRLLLADLAPLYQNETGHTVEVAIDSGKAMLERIKAGETADVVILGSRTVEDLARVGTVIDASRRIFSRTRIGVAVRRGFPKPDIGSVDALRRSMLAARSIAHTVHGASGQYIPALLEKLGIAEEMKAKTVTRPGGYIGPVVVTGEADVALQQLPELLAVEGLEVVGLLPEPVQKVLESSSGIFAASKNITAANGMQGFFAEPAHRDLFTRRGLEQLG